MFTASQGSLDEAINTVASKALAVYAKTTGAETITAAQMVNGLVQQDAAQALHNLTTPTAAQLVAAVVDTAAVGDMFEFCICNSNGGATITVVGGTGVTIEGDATVIATAGATFRGRFTNVTAAAEAVSLYRVG